MRAIYHHNDVMPGLILSGPELAANGFTPEMPVCILLRDNALWITPVHDEEFFIALLDSPDADVTADVIQKDGSLILAGGWLTTLDSRPSVVIEDGVIFIRLSGNDVMFEA